MNTKPVRYQTRQPAPVRRLRASGTTLNIAEFTQAQRRFMKTLLNRGDQTSKLGPA